jgi:peptide/nickel transport system substrate-binding protein
LDGRQAVKLAEAGHIDDASGMNQTRVAEVNKMQQYLYEKNPEIVLLYESDLQAYRSDRWTGFISQPQPQGSLLFAFGPQSYINIHPVSGGQAAGQDSGGSGGGGSSPILWIVLAAVVILIGGALIVRRRGKSAEDTE